MRLLSFPGASRVDSSMLLYVIVTQLLWPLSLQIKAQLFCGCTWGVPICPVKGPTCPHFLVRQPHPTPVRGVLKKLPSLTPIFCDPPPSFECVNIFFSNSMSERQIMDFPGNQPIPVVQPYKARVSKCSTVAFLCYAEAFEYCKLR